MKNVFLTLLLFSIFSVVFAQTEDEQTVFGNKDRNSMNANYYRSSWHNILVHHADQKYADEILMTYNIRPQSEKFNDHTISLEIMEASGEKYSSDKKIDKFVEENNVANEIVAKWFERNPENGYCDMSLIYRRGIEGAATENIEMAELVKRGKAILMDYGTELIGNTFVLVHDIIYIDKSERNQRRAQFISGLGDVLNSAMESMAESTGDDSYMKLGESIDNLSEATANIVDDFEGFRVKIQTHLYRLDWEDADNEFFYENYYLDENYYDENKFLSWQDAEYQLNYIGTQEVVCGNTVLAGIYNQSDLIKKVLYRTLDECVVELQKNYEEFRIKEPIYSVNDDETVIAKIGLKEGVDAESVFEVLERIETGSGEIKYKRVGTIRPQADMIWDNRYMSVEEGAVNAELEGTTFIVESGRDLYPGLLIREIEF